MSFRFCSIAIVLAMLVTTVQGQPQPQQPGVVVVPDGPINPNGIGIHVKTVEIDVPDGHKVVVLTRVYLNGKLDRTRCLAFLPAQGNGWSKHWVWASAYDPDVLLPDPTGKIKLATSNYDDKRGPIWVPAKDKRSITATPYVFNGLQVGQTMCVLSLKVGGLLAPDELGEALPAAPEWRATVMIRLEPMTEKELNRRRPADPATLVVDPKTFPYKDRDDAEPGLEQ